MKKFIQNFKDSLSNASFYKEKANEEHSTGFKYLLKLALFSGVIFYFVIVFIFYFSPFLGQVKNEINKNIPEDISVYIDKNGELSVNQPTPYIFPIPEGWKEEEKSNDEKDFTYSNILVIDPARNADETVFDAYDTMIFVSKDRLIIEKQENGEIRSYPLKNWSDTTLNREVIMNFITIIYKFSWILMSLIIIPISFIFFFFSLLIAFFASIVIYFFSKEIYKALSFKQSLNTAMYALTYVFLFDILLSIINLSPISGYFWIKVLLTIVVVAYFLSKKDMQYVEVNQTEILIENTNSDPSLAR